MLWRQAPPVRWLFKIGFACLWPVSAVLHAFWNTWLYGRAVKRETGKGLAAQVFEQIVLAYRDFVPPRTYYQYGFYDDARRQQASEFLDTRENRGIFSLLNGFYEQCDESIVEDKREFAAFCGKHGFPTPTVFAVFRKGKIVQPAPLSTLPECDLIAKPIHGLQGRGVRRWIREGGDSYRGQDGTVISAADLIAQLRSESNKRSLLLQERLYTHPELSGLTNGSLASARIVSGWAAGQEPVVVFGVFKMPFGSSIADNFQNGGVVSPIDFETGILGKGITKSLTRAPVLRHPGTDKLIEGVRVPYWKEAMELVVCAHREIRGYVFLGWDVAITADGPVLLETNDSWTFEMVQRAHSRPLGATRFVEICRAQLAHQAKVPGAAPA
jgi:hypothetical protein